MLVRVGSLVYGSGTRRVRTKRELLHVLDDPGCGGAERDVHRSFSEGGPARRGGAGVPPPLPFDSVRPAASLRSWPTANLTTYVGYWRESNGTLSESRSGKSKGYLAFYGRECTVPYVIVVRSVSYVLCSILCILFSDFCILSLWRGSSGGKSEGFITLRSAVRVRPPLPFDFVRPTGLTSLMVYDQSCYARW